MSKTSFDIVQLNSDWDRRAFTCGAKALDDYFHNRVTQDIRRKLATCFVAAALDPFRIAGFYTLAPFGVPLTRLPEDMQKKLPRYPVVGVAVMGRLAVATEFQQRKLGAALLADAIVRLTAGSPLVAHALVVEAKDNAAAGFYEHHGFVRLIDRPLTLLLRL